MLGRASGSQRWCGKVWLSAFLALFTGFESLAGGQPNLGIDPSHKVSSSRNLAIGRFWSAYFEAANAEMDPGDYSARLPSFR